MSPASLQLCHPVTLKLCLCLSIPQQSVSIQLCSFIALHLFSSVAPQFYCSSAAFVSYSSSALYFLTFPPFFLFTSSTLHSISLFFIISLSCCIFIFYLIILLSLPLFNSLTLQPSYSSTPKLLNSLTPLFRLFISTTLYLFPYFLLYFFISLYHHLLSNYLAVPSSLYLFNSLTLQLFNS